VEKAVLCVHGFGPAAGLAAVGQAGTRAARAQTAAGARRITLKSGETRTTVLLEDNPDHVLSATPGGAPEKLPRSATASPVSLMPPVLNQALGPQGLEDLLTFLMLPSPAESSTATP
jgi:hypothetical protein